MRRSAVCAWAPLLGWLTACESEVAAGPDPGAFDDAGREGADASTGPDASADAGPSPHHDASTEDHCALVGCGEPPLCALGCQSECGCCACSEGEREQRDGVELRCTGGCFAPVGDEPSCDDLPAELADALEVNVMPYTPPAGCRLELDPNAYLTVSDEQSFRQAFACSPEDESSGIDFAHVRLEIMPAGYAAPGNEVGREPRWARSKDGVLTIGWVEQAWCAGVAPTTAVLLALVPVDAPAMVASHGCTEGSCNWGDAGPPP